MTKLIIFLVFAYLQFSIQEELSSTKIPKDELIKEEILSSAEKNPDSKMLDGEDKNHWYKEKEGNKFDEDWTEEDEKWFQEIQEALEGSDEDYDYDFEEIEKLIDEIENWIKISHPKKSKYQWLYDLEKWFDDDFYNDDDYDQYPVRNSATKKEESVNVPTDSKDSVALYHLWQYKVEFENSKSKRAQPFKRFWSV